MSVVIDEVEKELSREYRTVRYNPNSLTVFSRITDATATIHTDDSRSFWCSINRAGAMHGIGNTFHNSRFIVDWVRKNL